MIDFLVILLIIIHKIKWIIIYLKEDLNQN